MRLASGILAAIWAASSHAQQLNGQDMENMHPKKPNKESAAYLSGNQHQNQHKTRSSGTAGQYKKQEQNYKSFLKPTIADKLASWLAPIIVVIFVISFEMGRRNRRLDKTRLA